MSDMTSLLTELVAGNGLMLATAIALPLVARHTRAAAAGGSDDFGGSLWALAITAAFSVGFVFLIMATGSIHGLLRYGYAVGEIIMLFAAFAGAWALLGPGRSKSRISGVGPMATPGP